MTSPVCTFISLASRSDWRLWNRLNVSVFGVDFTGKTESGMANLELDLLFSVLYATLAFLQSLFLLCKFSSNQERRQYGYNCNQYAIHQEMSVVIACMLDIYLWDILGGCVQRCLVCFLRLSLCHVKWKGNRIKCPRCSL